MFYFWWLVRSSQEPPSWEGGENFPECLRLFCLQCWFSQGPVVPLQHDPASVSLTLSLSDPQSHPHLSQWALVLGASFLSGVPPGGAAGSQLSTPPQAGARLGPLAPQGSIIPTRPPAPQLCSSLPCSLWEGLQFRLPRCIKTFHNQCLTSPLSFVNEIRPEEWPLGGVYPSPPSLPHSIEPMDWAFQATQFIGNERTSDNISFKTILKNTGRKYTNMIFLWINGFIHEFYFLLHAFLYFPNFLQCLYYVMIL